MLYIIYVISHFIFEAIFFSTKNLRHTGNPWFYSEDLMVMLIIELDFSWLMGTRSDE
jgi:hypothetical protein